MVNRQTVQDILRKFYPRYLAKYTPNAWQAKSAVHILNCKTGAYGTNVSRCDQCGHIQIHNNSCRDRSCPMCQALYNELWVDAQNEHVLDIDYYHLVFTCPSELNAQIYCNQKELYSLFFHAVAEAVMELSRNPAHMGGPPASSVSCTHGARTCPTILISMCSVQAAGLTRIETGTRKRTASSCPERQWPYFLRASSSPG